MYDISLRHHAVKLISSGKSLREVSDFLQISYRTLQRWVGCVKKGISLEPRTHVCRHRKIDKEALKAYVAQYPDKTLKEMGAVFSVHHSAIDHHLRRLHITLKKKRRSIKNDVQKND